MKLSHILTPECILPGLTGGERPKAEVVREILEVLYQRTSLKNEAATLDSILANMLEREREHSTAVGEGFAFPHARISGLQGHYLALALYPEGLQFEALDHQPVYYLVLSIVARSNPNLLLKSRAAMMRFLAPAERRSFLLKAREAQAIWRKIEEADIEVGREVCARDIMRPCIGRVHLDMSLREVAAELHRYQMDSLPVLDEQGVFIHDVSCQDLFTFGLPDFFTKLRTISFIRHMNPFEKYFEADRNLTVRDMNIQRTPPVIEPGATLMEIIFELSFRNQFRLYVVEDGRLLGVVDRYRIIDKILVSEVGENGA